MGINIKHVSGGSVLRMGLIVAPVMKPAVVPVTKRHPRSTIQVLLSARLAQLTAASIVEARRKARQAAAEEARLCWACE